MTKPFLKWAGGKRKMLPEIRKRLPRNFNAYFEPFLGGGSVFFDLNPRMAFLGDLNEELIHCYKAVASCPDRVIMQLVQFENSSAFYYMLRGLNPEFMTLPERAARFIYLNKTCFNGLHRVNKNGMFNVPWGKYKNPNFCDPVSIRAAHYRLKDQTIRHYGFEDLLKEVREFDFVYLDPPYVRLKDDSFTSYCVEDFGDEEHETLADILEDLQNRGAFWMLSNADTPWVRNRYMDFKIHSVQGSRSINSDGNGRGKVREVLITNYGG